MVTWWSPAAGDELDGKVVVRSLTDFTELLGGSWSLKIATAIYGGRLSFTAPVAPNLDAA